MTKAVTKMTAPTGVVANQKVIVRHFLAQFRGRGLVGHKMLVPSPPYQHQTLSWDKRQLRGNDGHVARCPSSDRTNHHAANTLLLLQCGVKPSHEGFVVHVSRTQALLVQDGDDAFVPLLNQVANDLQPRWHRSTGPAKAAQQLARQRGSSRAKPRHVPRRTLLLKYSIASHSMPSLRYSSCSDLSVSSMDSC